MDDVVGASLFGKVVQRAQIAYSQLSVWIQWLDVSSGLPTSDICDAQDSYATGLNHTAIVGEKGSRAGERTSVGALGSVWQIAWVVVGMGAWLQRTNTHG